MFDIFILIKHQIEIGIKIGLLFGVYSPLFSYIVFHTTIQDIISVIICRLHIREREGREENIEKNLKYYTTLLVNIFLLCSIMPRCIIQLRIRYNHLSITKRENKFLPLQLQFAEQYRN